MRQIVLDTETTGLSPATGHRIVELACIELVDRRKTENCFHHYINPERESDLGAAAVHGLSTEFLANKPKFAEIVDSFVEFVRGAELVIHNAPFDMGFINSELKLLGMPPLDTVCASVCDTLPLARQKHPGKKNSLDALCVRYQVDNAHRDLHGALLDADLLAEVFLRMTSSKNLFSCCPKELVLDGFLEWLFTYLNGIRNEDAKLHLINSLFSVSDSEGDQTFQDVSDIKAKRQEENVDLMVRFKSKGTDYAVLFENKTWSSPHSGQLARYRKSFPDRRKYIYLKLAFVPYAERKEVERWDEKKHGYVVVTSSQLLDAIEPLRSEHPFIEEFYEYLLCEFVTPQKQLANELFKDDFEKLKDAEAQQYVLSELHEKLAQHTPKLDLKFKAQSNVAGRPFTTLRIARNKDEYIYWRIDKRSHRYYIRLTQYSKIGDTGVQQKIERLNELRDIASKLNFEWTPGKLTNGNYDESEIAIFFFDKDKNKLSEICKGLEKYSLDFIEKYSEFNQLS